MFWCYVTEILNMTTMQKDSLIHFDCSMRRGSSQWKGNGDRKSCVSFLWNTLSDFILKMWLLCYKMLVISCYTDYLKFITLWVSNQVKIFYRSLQARVLFFSASHIFIKIGKTNRGISTLSYILFTLMSFMKPWGILCYRTEKMLLIPGTFGTGM